MLFSASIETLQLLLMHKILYIKTCCCISKHYPSLLKHMTGESAVINIFSAVNDVY